MVYDEQRGEVVLFGGMGANNRGLDDTWVWSGTNWTRKSPAIGPPARYEHAMAYDPVRKRVVLFGGVTEAEIDANDTWTWDGANWARAIPPVSPPGRNGHGLAWDAARQVLLLYGGFDKTDTWVWDGSTWTDKTAAANSGGLTKSVMVSHGGRVLVVGGWPNSTTSDQTWVWDGSVWKQLMIDSTAPRTVEAASTWDPVRDRTLFFGGWTGGEEQSSSTWSLAIKQACTFEQPPVLTTVVSSGSGSIQLSVPAAAGCAWSASSSVPWINVLNPSGTGPGTLTASYQPNPGVFRRDGTIRVSGREYAVAQSRPPCPVAGPLPAGPFELRNGCSTTFSYSAAAGEQIAIRAIGTGSTYGPRDMYRSSHVTIQVAGPAPSSVTIASASARQSWEAVTYLSASGTFSFPASGTYSITFTMIGADNPEVGAEGSSTIHWMKKGDVCNPDINAYSVYFRGGKPDLLAVEWNPVPPGFNYLTRLSIGVPPGCPPVSISTSAPWVRSPVSSAGPGYTSVAPEYDMNFGPERTATLSVGSWSVPVRQAAAECSFTIGSAGASVPAVRTSGTVQLTTAGQFCPWTTSSNVSWLQPYPLTGSGNAAIQYTAFPNFGSKARQAAIHIAGRAFTLNQAGGSGTMLQRFVRLLYFSFLGRMPSEEELAYQVNSGLSRQQLALNFFLSPEFNAGGRFVAGLYVSILNRDAEYSGWLFQRDALSNRLVNHDSIVDNFIGSAEFFQRFGYLNDRAFVTLLYQQVLMRTPTTSEVDFHAGTIAGGLSRVAVARNFLNSTEFVTGAYPRLSAFLVYATLLQRDATSPELAAASAIAAKAQALMSISARQLVIRDELLSPIVNGPEINKILE
jgi:hypothetical protein